jgi:ribosome biogenesis GTPase A
MALQKSSGAADVHRSLLELNDHVRTLLGKESDIKLPTIAVIGNQSAGKSSVLERLCGVQLPRGAGTVTKVPAVLSMRQAEAKSVRISEGDGASRCISEAEVPEAMQHATEHILKAEQEANGLGSPPAFSCTPINLRIEGPEQQNLTVVDLPGIVYFIRRSAEAGARSSEIDGSTEAAIKDMYMKYVADPNCVILCTLPATEEPGTQKAYLWAREVDPEGRRTLGVITKTDRADNSMGNLADRMKGEGVNGWDFALGVVALRNSTQEEAAAGQTAKETDEKESLFFQGHKDLKRLEARYKGLASLEARLVELSKKMIAEATPGVLTQVRAKIHAVQASLQGLPLALTDNVSRHMEMYRRLQAFMGDYKTLYERRMLAPDASSVGAIKPTENADFPVLEALARQLALLGADDAAASAAGLTAGAGMAAAADAGAAAAVEPARFMRLMARLTDLCGIFKARVRGSLADLFSAGFRAAIELELEEAKGGGLPDSVPEYVTERLVAADAAGFKPAADALVSGARQYMGFVLRRLAQEHFIAYPQLETQVQVAVRRFLDAAEAQLKKRVEELIAIEADIFTLNHYYGDTVRTLLTKLPAVVRMERQGPSNSLVEAVLAGVYDERLAESTPAASAVVNNSNIEHSVLQVQVRLYAYRKVMLKRFLDEVCGFMRLMLPRAFVTVGQDTILRQLLGGGGRSEESGAEAGDGTGLTLEALMAAAPEVEQQRGRLQDSLQRLKIALKLLEKMQASLQTSGMTVSGVAGAAGAGAAATASR